MLFKNIQSELKRDCCPLVFFFNAEILVDHEIKRLRDSKGIHKAL